MTNKYYLNIWCLIFLYRLSKTSFIVENTLPKYICIYVYIHISISWNLGIIWFSYTIYLIFRNLYGSHAILLQIITNLASSCMVHFTCPLLQRRKSWKSPNAEEKKSFCVLTSMYLRWLWYYEPCSTNLQIECSLFCINRILTYAYIQLERDHQFYEELGL